MLRPTAPEGQGWPCSASRHVKDGQASVSGQLTPRQACPQPNGLGRNLRSKTRWFTGFCNSHHVSHFATFFIDARAEISVAESHSIICSGDVRTARPRSEACCFPVYLGVNFAPGFNRGALLPGRQGGATGPRQYHRPGEFHHCARVILFRSRQ